MILKYKKFIAEINYISRTGCFYGEVINSSDLIIFQAEYKKDLEESFKIAAEQYLALLEFIDPPIQALTVEQETLI